MSPMYSTLVAGSLSIQTLIISYQFSLVIQSCLTLCDPMDRSTPGLPVHHHSWSLPKLMSIESVMPSSHLIAAVAAAAKRFSHVRLRPHGLQPTRPPCPSPLLEFTQTHVHRVGDVIQPSHLLSSPSPPTCTLSQHQDLFK